MTEVVAHFLEPEILLPDPPYLRVTIRKVRQLDLPLGHPRGREIKDYEDLCGVIMEADLERYSQFEAVLLRSRLTIKTFLEDVNKRFSGQAHSEIMDSTGLMIRAQALGKDRYDGRTKLEHILGVANILMTEFGIQDPDTVMIGVNHDLVEDNPKEGLALRWYSTEGTEEELQERLLEAATQRYGSVLSTGLREVSSLGFDRLIAKYMAEHPGVSKLEAKRAVYHACHRQRKDLRAKIVKAADRIDNMRYLGRVSDAERKAHLARKYPPIIREFDIPLVEEAALNSNHPLHAKSKEIKKTMEELLLNGRQICAEMGL